MPDFKTNQQVILTTDIHFSLDNSHLPAGTEVTIIDKYNGPRSLHFDYWVHSEHRSRKFAIRSSEIAPKPRDEDDINGWLV